MQVKKFEARTMKEALEMVKTQLGPDAIILSARDNNKSFGLVGEGSVEITAAVSEDTLHKKRFVESRINDRDKQRFQQSPAKVQKTIIDSMVKRHLDTQTKPVTRQRYIEIDDAKEIAHQEEVANARIKNAAQRAWASFANNTWQEVTPAPAAIMKTTVAPVSLGPVDKAEISQLKNEIAGLKDLLNRFENMPQQFVSSYPGQSDGIPYELSFMFERLVQSGVSEDFVVDILNQVQETVPIAKLKNKSLIEGWVAKHILETTRIETSVSEKKFMYLWAVQAVVRPHNW